MHPVFAVVVVLIMPMYLWSGTEKVANTLPQSSASSSSLAAMPSVALSVGLDELPEGNATEAAVTVTYSDGKTKKIPFGFQ